MSYEIKFKNGKVGKFDSLVDADLSDANLRCADLFNTSIFAFQLGKHFAFYHEGYLKIGCKGFDLEYWFKNVEEIGMNEDYKDHEILDYRAMIEFLYNREKRSKL